MTDVRQTKYLQTAEDYMRTIGHATNAEVLTHLRQQFPELSATTVHRLTARMVERGKLAYAPVSPGNAVRFDINRSPHDHFECLACGCLRDVNLPADLLDSLQNVLGDCRFGGRLNVQGTCAKCIEKGEV